MSFLSKTFAARPGVECTDLERIEALLTSGKLLDGLLSCAGLPSDLGISDMDAAFTMMVDQSV